MRTALSATTIAVCGAGMCVRVWHGEGPNGLGCMIDDGFFACRWDACGMHACQVLMASIASVCGCTALSTLAMSINALNKHTASTSPYASQTQIFDATKQRAKPHTAMQHAGHGPG